MFAAAMAFSLGIKLDAIRQGLRTFDSTFFQAPGRMNVFNEHPFKVLFDYGHNAHAVRHAGGPRAARWTSRGRRIVVLAGPGDRRDEDLVAIANAVAGRFDHYICRRDDNLRERAPDEVPRIQAQALRAPGVRTRRSRSSPTSRKRSTRRCAWASRGDLLLVFADALVRSWKQITKFRPSKGRGAQPACRRQRRGREPAAVFAFGRARAGEPSHGTFSLEGLIRDERGMRMAPEVGD